MELASFPGPAHSSLAVRNSCRGPGLVHRSITYSGAPQNTYLVTGIWRWPYFRSFRCTSSRWGNANLSCWAYEAMFPCCPLARMASFCTVCISVNNNVQSLNWAAVMNNLAWEASQWPHYWVNFIHSRYYWDWRNCPLYRVAECLHFRGHNIQLLMVMQSMPKQNIRYVSTFQRLTGKYHKFVAICTDNTVMSA